MNGAVAREQESIDALARRFGGALRQYFNRRIPQQPDIEDLVQEVFLRLVRRGGLEGIENVDGYVFSIASNVLRDRFRDRQATSADQHQDLEENVVEESAFSPERVLQGKEALRRLLSALDVLPERTQVVFMRCVFHQQPQEVVAEDLGMTTRNVRKHLKKAYEHLDQSRSVDW